MERDARRVLPHSMHRNTIFQLKSLPNLCSGYSATA